MEEEGVWAEGGPRSIRIGNQTVREGDWFDLSWLSGVGRALTLFKKERMKLVHIMEGRNPLLFLKDLDGVSEQVDPVRILTLARRPTITRNPPRRN